MSRKRQRQATPDSTGSLGPPTPRQTPAFSGVKPLSNDEARFTDTSPPTMHSSERTSHSKSPPHGMGQGKTSTVPQEPRTREVLGPHENTLHTRRLVNNDPGNIANNVRAVSNRPHLPISPAQDHPRAQIQESTAVVSDSDPKHSTAERRVTGQRPRYISFPTPPNVPRYQPGIIANASSSMRQVAHEPQARRHSDATFRPGISPPNEPPRQDHRNRRQRTVSYQNPTLCPSCNTTHVIDPEHDGSLVRNPLPPLRHDAVQPRTIPTDYASRPLPALPSANMPASRPLDSVSQQELDANLLLSFASQARRRTEQRPSFTTCTNAATRGLTSLTPLADFLEERALAARIAQQSAPVRATASTTALALSPSGMELLATLLTSPDDAAQQPGCKFVRMVKVGPLQIPVAVTTCPCPSPAGVPPLETITFSFVRGTLDRAYRSRTCYLCGNDRALYGCTPPRWPEPRDVDNMESLARSIMAMVDANTAARQRREQ